MTKVRTSYLFLDGEEIKKIADKNLGGITIKCEVRHSRIELSAWTGEDEKIEATQTE